MNFFQSKLVCDLKPGCIAETEENIVHLSIQSHLAEGFGPRKLRNIVGLYVDYIKSELGFSR